jgi:hypothetical protein
MPIVTRMSKKSLFLVLQISSDNKDNYVLIKEKPHSFSVIPTTYEDKSMKDSWHRQKGN